MGNYLGALRNWVVGQYECDAFHGIVDLHALTVTDRPGVLGTSTLELAATLFAVGLDPEVPLTSQSREMVQAYVGKGLGFTLVGFPPSRNLTIEGDIVVTRPLAQEIGQFEVVLAMGRRLQQTELITAFLDMCRAQI